MEDVFELGGEKLTSRFLLGTGKFGNNKDMPAVIKASGAKIITVALRRADPGYPEENIMRYIPKDCIVMPNTSGARTAAEAVRIAHMARAMGCGNWIKIEVIADNRFLMPDNQATIEATEILAKEGFIVLPYMSPDLMSAKRLQAAGASAVMPLAAPIGSNRGLETKELIRILIDEVDLPIIVDAGIGKPSEAAEAMEMGAAAVLVNTAVAIAGNPIDMAEAFQLAVKAGRKAYLSGIAREIIGGNPSSPLTGFLHDEEVHHELL